MNEPVYSEAVERQRLVALLTQHQRRVFGYIHALIPDPHDAEDLLQETNHIICEKFHEFEPGTDFVAWACQIAWWQVRKARLKYARSRVLFDDDVLEAVARTGCAMTEELDERREALSHCLNKLQPRDRTLVLTRYERGCGVEEAAQHSGRSIEAAYKALTRIRKMLFDCITHRLAMEKYQ